MCIRSARVLNEDRRNKLALRMTIKKGHQCCYGKFPLANQSAIQRYPKTISPWYDEKNLGQGIIPCHSTS